MKKYNEAIDDYTIAIQYSPSLARAWYNRSGTYYTIGEKKLALSDALKAKNLGYPVDEKYIDILKEK
jgi:tetratricopeptide (TPR) repeat protein